MIDSIRVFQSALKERVCFEFVCEGKLHAFMILPSDARAFSRELAEAAANVEETVLRKQEVAEQSAAEG